MTMEEKEAKNKIRLNRFLAQAGLCSRRKADELIAAGHVRINNTLVTEMGERVDPDKDSVTFKGKKISLSSEQKHTYLLLHKPIEVISTVKDPQNRETVMDFIPNKYKGKRLYPVGRLDFFSEGLLLLTDDGKLTYRMTHPSYELPKNYEVLIRERPDNSDLEIMRKGMTLAEGEELAPVEVSYSEDEETLYLVLRQGLNRQIRRMCRDLNLTILRLKRLSIGPIELKDLPQGHCRELSKEEVQKLYRAVNLKA